MADARRNRTSLNRTVRRLALWTIRRRGVVAVFALLVAVGFGVALSGLRVGYSVRSFTESQEPELARATAHYDEFEVPDGLLLFCYPEPDPWAPSAMARGRAIDAAFRAHRGVSRVVTLWAAPGIRATDDGQELRRRYRGSQTWRQFLVGRDEKTVGGMVWLRRDPVTGIGDDAVWIRELRALGADLGVDLRFSGVPYHRATIQEIVRKEQELFVPLGALLTSLGLLLFLRSLALVTATLVVVPFTLLCGLGGMALCGVEITLVTSTLPIMLMAIAVADGVHIVSRFVDERVAGREPERAAVRSIVALWAPCFLTSLTTAIGFATLLVTSVPDLRELGAAAAFGIACAFVFTVLCLPPLLVGIASSDHVLRAGRPLGWLGRLGRFGARLPVWPTLGGFGLLTLAALVVTLWVRPPGGLRDDLWSESDLVQEQRFYEQRFVEMVPSEVLVSVRGDGPAFDGLAYGSHPASAAFDRLVDWLEALPSADRSLSVRDLRRDGMPAPLLRSAGAMAGLLSADGRTARILLFQRDLGNEYFRGLSARVAAASSNWPELEVRAGGIQVVATTIIHRLTRDLGWSFLGSLLVISVCVTLRLRSLRLGIAAILPCLLPMVWNLGLMALLDITLRPLTVISFCVAFGLAVDDAIYLLTHYQRRRARMSIDEAIDHTWPEIARPVVTTSVLLLVGFSVALFGESRGTFQFGMLVMTAVSGALISALFVLPAWLRAQRG